ncbi:hypothetical protein GKZ68_03775 [Hymenobacter sp. BRD128]|uniref:hypothetical protein n=1 Tax=Hymenobacter sp. BRD128 TaxID=2675878 RepID=UPI001564A837|nr:hypothetical protein [Hymenobacter sp. BRD128]QKG55835.1 hypothetical protein GKZ68_03775 [Hymenobacter sp. BRD128]
MAGVGSSRVREWLRRYGPAELLSLLATVGAAAAQAGGTRAAVALAATWAGNGAYFGLLLLQDISHTRAALRTQGRPYLLATFGRNVRALVVEFGVAEVFDSLLVRPAFLYWLPQWLHSVPLGVLAAKFAADVTFYVPAIISYELSKKKLRKF